MDVSLGRSSDPQPFGSRGVQILVNTSAWIDDYRFAAALATDPGILFMDEPLAGLNETEIEIFADLIERVNAERGIAPVLGEHKGRTLARMSSRIMILNFGQLVRMDAPDVIMSDPEIIELYLGKFHAA